MQRDRHIGPGLHITFWPHNAMPLPSIGPVFECTRISNQATLCLADYPALSVDNYS